MNKIIIIIISVSALVLLATAPWMNNKSIQNDILQKYGRQDGSIDKNGNLFCAYEAKWLPFGRWVVSCEGGYFVPFFYFKKGNNDNAQKQQIHENNKVATENVFCGKNYTAEILKINDTDIIKRIIEIWEGREGKCELNFGGENLGIAKKVSSDGKIYHIVIYDKDDKEQSRHPFDQSLEQFEININDNTVSYLLPLDGSFFEIGKFKFTE